jgi:hypothetical protein
MKPELEHLIEAVPATIFAAAMARSFGQLCGNAEHQRTAERMLLGLWHAIRPELTPAVLRQPTGKVAAAAVLLEEYFLRRGNWQAMEATLFGAACKRSDDPIAAARLIDVISEAVTVVARDYTKDHAPGE